MHKFKDKFVINFACRDDDREKILLLADGAGLNIAECTRRIALGGHIRSANHAMVLGEFIRLLHEADAHAKKLKEIEENAHCAEERETAAKCRQSAIKASKLISVLIPSAENLASQMFCLKGAHEDGSTAQ